MLNKNETYIVEITGMSHEGMGVGKVDGFTVFVEGAIVGEKVEIKIVKINKNFGFGKLTNIIEPSPARIEPICKAHKQCGGCSFQHVDYREQLRFKTDKVKDTIKRIGKIDDVVIHDIIGMNEPLRYRNKAQYPVGMKDGKIALGFYAARSHDIVDIEECMLQDIQSEKITKILREFISKNNISVYDETAHKGFIRHIVTKVGFKTDEIMLVVVTNGEGFPQKEQFIKEIKDNIPNVKSIIQNINREKTNVILGNKNILLYGSNVISDYIGEFKFNISANSFYQVNPIQTEVLYNKALEYANLTGCENVFDAYCGIGTISLFLSKNAKKVYGIEIVPQAIIDAKENAQINNVDNVEFIEGESEVIIPKLYSEGVMADVVVVDPPRKGCDKKLLDTIIQMQPKRVVYVSCDVGTLARDLRILEDGGYKAVEVQPVDMFPYTYHVEVVTLLTRSEVTK